MVTPASDFVARYGAVYEHSPWVAERAEQVVTAGDDIEVIARVMADCVDNAAMQQQLELIRAHPDLAGKAQVAGELTEHSGSEQSSAGLDQCSAEEYERFQLLNRQYRDKFGFPFIMAVRDRSRAEILAAFEARLGNDPATEFETALAEIHKIAGLRLRAMEVL
ncbi:MAG: 2-oxo-4-hydroxy-4-carboxy-5-ureidoimidazoline decarboxylase [Gammaproteobacteria bacterium]|nr:2-oxo-4-hydroxy-4-carboxy-5-ureidoimidazoline decarboxylase [Gammaproteobacteria bacterium]